MMRISLILLMFISVVPNVRASCYPSAILIDPNHGCQIDPEIFVPYELLIVLGASEYPWDMKQVTFEVENWIGNPGYPIGQTSVTWFADEVQGSIDGEIALTWDEGLPPIEEGGDTYLLGEIEFFTFDPDWPENGHEIRFKNLVYEDIGGHGFLGDESRLTFTDDFDDDGCYPFNWDPPSGGWRTARYFVPPSGSEVPNEFILEFEVHSHECIWWPEIFQGSVKLEGETVFEFEGITELELSVPISVQNLDPGDAFTVEVLVDFYPIGEYIHTYELVYTVENGTPTRDTTFSEIKSRY